MRVCPYTLTAVFQGYTDDGVSEEKEEVDLTQDEASEASAPAPAATASAGPASSTAPPAPPEPPQLTVRRKRRRYSEPARDRPRRVVRARKCCGQCAQ